MFSQALAADLPSRKPATPPGTYLNPVGDPPIHLQDPYVFVYGKKYFLFGTASPAEAFTCYESSDLAHWNPHGWAWRRTDLSVARGDLHSPQVFLYNGFFCLLYSARMLNGTQLALAASTKPEGPYHDLHAPWLSLGQDSTDGNVFIDDNSKAYLTFSQRTAQNGHTATSVYGVALNKDLSDMIGKPVKLLEASQLWELSQSSASRCNETPRIFRQRSRYYLTYSANNRSDVTYGIGYAMADKPLGPWTKARANPLLSSRAELGVLAPGRGAVFRSVARKDWFIVYDSFTDPANPSGDRVINVDRIGFADNQALTSKGPTRSPQPLP